MIDWLLGICRVVWRLQDTNYWKQQLWSAHDRVDCEVLQGMHDQGLPVVKVRIRLFLVVVVFVLFFVFVFCLVLVIPPP